MSCEPEHRVLSQARAEDVLNEALSFASAKGNIRVVISSWWGGGQRWARNRPTMTADQREITITIERRINGGTGEVETNQLDSVSLKGAMQCAERYALEGERNNPLDMEILPATSSASGSDVWSDVTYNRAVRENGHAVIDVTRKSIEDNLLSAGYIGTTASTALIYIRNTWGKEHKNWGMVTFANCSVTVRHPKGLGSGWAGQSAYDLARWKVEDIAALAYDKCKLSLNPVRIEPGRYAVILEPQAVATLTGALVGSLNRTLPESGNHRNSPIYFEFEADINRHTSKIGLQLVDSRLNIYHDPTDPLVGTHRSEMVRRVDLIKKGVLTEVYNKVWHETVELFGNNPAIPRSSYRVDGGETTIDEMIRTTRKGILVAKLEQAMRVDEASMMYTGVTRDGLWLIENGKITKAIKNFRWTESPLFALNNIELLGVPEPVYSSGWSRAPLLQGFHNSLHNVVVPPMRIKDFNFSSTIDAI